MNRLFRLWKWFRDRKTGYQVSVYDCSEGSWIRADHLGGDRYLVKHEKHDWELRTESTCGYDACREAEEWFKDMKK